MFLNRLTLRQKITAIGVSQLALVGVVLFTLYYRDAKEKIQQQYLERSRSVVLTAESTREEMGKKWDKGIFTTGQLRAWAEKGEKDNVLDAIPVVTAWRAAMAKAHEGGYEFKVPKFQPRNPKNEPDKIEAEAIRLIEANNLTEHWVVDEERNSIRYFRPIRLTNDCMACHGDPATSMALWGNDKGLDPTGARMENWKVGEIHGAFEIVQPLTQAQAALRTSMFQGGAVVLGLIALGGSCFFWLVTRTVIRPVKAMITVSQAIAGGDLTRTCPTTGQDEISQLAGSLNSMGASLKAMVSDILGKAGRLNGSAQDLCATARQLAGGAEKTSEQSVTVSAAAEELSANMQTMSGSTDQMSASVRTVSAAVEEMTASISEVARSAEQAATVADSAARLAESSNAKISDLGSAANEIGKVIEVIQDIAEQTNLLALNATIEAARAGEAGKGFAVVATEVKELARQTGSATEDIRKRIESIQTSTQETVQAIGEIEQVIKRVNDVSRTIASAVEEQSITTKEIARSVAGTSTAAESVATNVSQSAAASQEITRSITEVSQAASETKQGAAQAQSSGENLLSVATELQEMVSAFKI